MRIDQARPYVLLIARRPARVATPVTLGVRGAIGGEPWVEIVAGLADGAQVLARAAPGVVRDGTPVRRSAAPRRAGVGGAVPAAAAVARPQCADAAMWFTRVSIGNPVLATMVMLAFVVLGLFSYQRLAVDQFPNIDFPTVVVVMDYPGASPEIVESEVTKKIEEAVNTVAGINTLYSRSYEGTSVVIVEFNLDVDGRKAADDVREKVALIRPLLRDEVKEPRISRFDPQSVPIFNVAVLADGRQAQTPQELTTWATQVLQKRLENVRGVGSVSVVGGLGAADQHLPEAGGARGARHRRRPGRRRGAQREPGAAARRDPLARAGARGADQRAAEAPRGLPRHRRRAQGSAAAAARRAGQALAGRRHRRRPAGGREPGALQRPAHGAAVGAEVAGREHDRGRRRPAQGARATPSR